MEERGTARAADGYELAVTRFPAQGTAIGTLLIAGAMAVPQEFYAALARFHALNGLHVLTFDYRGMGRSRSGPMRACDTDVSRWAEQDLAAMLHEARRPAPGLPLFVVGHSLGGQILGAAPGNDQIRAIVTVTAGSGYYRYNDRIPVRVRILWFAAMPVVTALFGYFPGKALRMVGDLPGGVARQWRRWCVHPDYLLSEGAAYRAAFERVKAPIVGYSFEDDEIITRSAIDNLHGFYRCAAVERRHLRPADVGEKRIGHFGFFSERSRGTLWKESLEWMRARA